MKQISLPCMVGLILFFLGCGGGTNSGPTGSLSLTLASSSALVFTGGSTATVNASVSLTGTSGSVTLSVAGLPAGASVQIQSPGTGNSGSVTIDPGSAAAGTYTLTVTATSGQLSDSARLSLTVGAVAQISPTTSGKFQLAMSTSFQPAEWDSQFFVNFPGATTPLANLQDQHIRLQPVSQGTPQKGDQTWDFSTLDAILDPVIGVGDKSPELQLAQAPPWMNDINGHLTVAHYPDFATYAANMVRYYNTAIGFQDPPGTWHVHSSFTPVTWWGIFNEPNINGISNPQDYTDLYNMVVPAMQAVDPSIKFAAVELSDGYNNWEQTYFPTFVSQVKAQVDVVATHFYSSCNQKDPDLQLFGTIPGFASGVEYIYSQLQPNPKLANVPVWITENNVNADFQGANGMSMCNPNQKFVTDTRGSSAFFAAWRPVIFSQLGKAGAQALYQWVFAGDAQYGEIDDSTGNPRLSYWVDYWLEHMFPCPPGADLLDLTSSDNVDIEILPVRNPDNSVVVMVADYAVASASDNNGPGAPRTISLDVSALGTFTSASLMTIDASTNVASGPTPASISPASPIQLTLNGYGVSFLKLQP